MHADKNGIVGLQVSGQEFLYLSQDGIAGKTLDLWSDCVEVLQKPSEEEMRSTEGLIRVDSETGEEFVFTDSAYWINSALMQELAAFYRYVMLWLMGLTYILLSFT